MVHTSHKPPFAHFLVTELYADFLSNVGTEKASKLMMLRVEGESTIFLFLPRYSHPTQIVSLVI